MNEPISTSGHVDYPHEPGRLYGCGECEDGPCACNPETDAPCVSRECVQGCPCGDSECDGGE